jgi:large subunit ribosomal protein L21
MYAVIEDSGTQIKVSEGDVIKVAIRDLPEDQIQLTFDRVLLIGGNGSTKVGSPLVAGAKVTADILEEGRGEKIEIWKFRRRKNYVRHKGHRQDFLRVKVTGISA